jgi:hypothetical protein
LHVHTWEAATKVFNLSPGASTRTNKYLQKSEIKTEKLRNLKNVKLGTKK